MKPLALRIAEKPINEWYQVAASEAPTCPTPPPYRVELKMAGGANVGTRLTKVDRETTDDR